jgi:hypothetical protein
MTNIIDPEAHPCEVCGDYYHKLHVHASSLGPISIATCGECLAHRAEPEFTFHYMYDHVGHRGRGLADLSHLSTWKPPFGYMTWTEWVAWRRDPIREAELDARAKADLEKLQWL